MRASARGIVLLVLACSHVFAGTPGPNAQRQGRMAAPALKCPRDNTTSFTGRVIAYTRARGKVFVRVRTDEETTEQFTLRYGSASGLARIFRLYGEPFGPGDLSKIERRAGVLRPGMRATVWACYEGDEPSAELIDWRPPEQ